MRLSERLFQIMRQGRKYHPKWIAKRMGLNVDTARGALGELKRGGVIRAYRSPANKRVRLYETNQLDLWRLHG
jgi:ribosomal protein S25